MIPRIFYKYILELEEEINKEPINEKNINKIIDTHFSKLLNYNSILVFDLLTLAMYRTSNIYELYKNNNPNFLMYLNPLYWLVIKILNKINTINIFKEIDDMSDSEHLRKDKYILSLIMFRKNVLCDPTNENDIISVPKELGFT